MDGIPASYNIGAIRKLLLTAFTPEELRRFCLDHNTFRPVVVEFGPGHGLADMVDRLIDYCRTKLLWPELLSEVAAYNPPQYKRFRDQVYEGPLPDVTPAPTPALRPTKKAQAHGLSTLPPFYVARPTIEADILSLLSQRNWVTIVGAPGIGKTELARSVGWILATQGSSVVYVDVARATTKEELVSRFWSSFNQVLGGHRQPNEEALQSALLSFEGVVIVDNLEDGLYSNSNGDKARGFYMRLQELAGPVFLATSRTAIGGRHELQYVAEGLTPDETHKLFINIITDSGCLETSMKGETWKRVLELLDGIPLAVILLARLAKDYYLCNIEDLVTEYINLKGKMLDENFGQLVGFPSLGNRYPSLDAALTISWKHLTARARSVVEVVALCPHGVFMHDLRHLLSTDTHLRSAVADLSRHSLIRSEIINQRTFVNLLEPIRDFVLESRPKTDLADDKVLQRVASFFLSEENSTQVAALMAVDSSSDRYLLGLSMNALHFLQLVQRDTSLEGATRAEFERRCARYLSNTIAVFHRLGLRTDTKRVVDYAISCALRYPEESLPAAKLRVHRANNLHIIALELDRAVDDLGHAIPVLEREGCYPDLIYAQQRMGVVQQLQQRFDEARRWYGESLAMAREKQLDGGIGTSYSLLGWLAEERGQFEQATSLYETAMRYHTKAEDQLQLIIDITALGKIARRSGRYDLALRHLQEALDTLKEYPYPWGRAQALLEIGLTKKSQGMFDEAIQLLAESRALYAAEGDVLGMNRTSNALDEIESTMQD